MTSFSAQDESFSIYDFKAYLDKHMKFHDNDEWIDNSRYAKFDNFIIEIIMNIL